MKRVTGSSDDRDGQAVTVDLYGANYARFDTPLYGEIRKAAFGEDLRSNSWLTREELAQLPARLGLGPASRLLDVACGPGGTALALARETRCEAVGLDLHEQVIGRARAAAGREGLGERVRFEVFDASAPLPFPAESFDAVLCVDAINHLPDRAFVLGQWRRVLRPGGRLLFTDPVVVTGPVSQEEIRQRSAIGFYLFVPDGQNEKMLEQIGLDLIAKEDTTGNVELIAQRRWEARQARAEELRQIEGKTFEGQQKFLQTCSRLARERRLSRFLYVAQSRGGP